MDDFYEEIHKIRQKESEKQTSLETDENTEITDTLHAENDNKNYDNRVFQTTDNMRSDYRENKSDGYSWREREVTYDKKDTVLSKDKLLSTKWMLDYAVNPYSPLLFYSDDVFKFGTYQAGVLVEGSYKIIDNRVFLFDYKLKDNYLSPRIFAEKEMYAQLYFESSHVMFDNELIINNVSFYPIGSEKEDGKRAIVSGIEVITETQQKVMTDNVRFRVSPNTDSQTIIIARYWERGKKTDSIKRGDVISTLAKTVYEDTIDGITAPWYYICVSESEGHQYGWVFGGYFAPYFKEKEDEYKKMLETELRNCIDKE
ncbi:hypothetical protein H0R92_05005 [Treponema sp. OMZ 840]|uniref:hypothetical protein n=1 Tax=Treponema sp. OMZ 840 TaxID=244313 RepID=UPI003D8AA3C6